MQRDPEPSIDTTGYRVVQLFSADYCLQGEIVIPPFPVPPIVVTWRGMAFLRMPRDDLPIIRYREVSGYGVPEEQEMLDDT